MNFSNLFHAIFGKNKWRFLISFILMGAYFSFHHINSPWEKKYPCLLHFNVRNICDLCHFALIRIEYRNENFNWIWWLELHQINYFVNDTNINRSTDTNMNNDNYANIITGSEIHYSTDTNAEIEIEIDWDWDGDWDGDRSKYWQSHKSWNWNSHQHQHMINFL